MEYIIIIIICLIFLCILGYIFGLNLKKIKKIAENRELDEVTSTFPENMEICKSILKRLGNDKVKIKEETESKTSLYVVVTDTITIANIRDSFTRVQTIAHECLHSVQSKKMLWFNFIYTNLYGLFFLITLILTIVNVIKVRMLFLAILILLGFVHYTIRSMLETDAMTKARYVAKEYLEDNNICDKSIIERIIKEYDYLNDLGIKMVNYQILQSNILKVIIYSLLCVFV